MPASAARLLERRGPFKRPLIVGNWKMNGLESDLGQVRQLAKALSLAPNAATVVICPPATLLAEMARLIGGTRLEIGGQDCHLASGGAHTGEISAPMLRDAGAAWVILGHSERRRDRGETDAEIAAKAWAAAEAGLRPIICVGESLAERQAGRTESVVARQARAGVPRALAGTAFAVAYEPAWAIGTDSTPAAADIAAVHQAIRNALAACGQASVAEVPVLYGGSVSAGNADEILATEGVGGLLVGRASLSCETFLPIVRAAVRSNGFAGTLSSTAQAAQRG